MLALIFLMLATIRGKKIVRLEWLSHFRRTLGLYASSMARCIFSLLCFDRSLILAVSDDTLAPVHSLWRLVCAHGALAITSTNG